MIDIQAIRNVLRKAHKVRTKSDTDHDGVRIDIPVDNGWVFGVEDADRLQERFVEGLAG